MKLIKQETRDLGNDMIDNCQEWHQSHHTFSNGNIQIWTSNIPMFDIDTYPNTNSFNVFERLYLHRCIKKSIIKKGIQK